MRACWRAWLCASSKVASSMRAARALRLCVRRCVLCQLAGAITQWVYSVRERSVRARACDAFLRWHRRRNAYLVTSRAFFFFFFSYFLSY